MLKLIKIKDIPPSGNQVGIIVTVVQSVCQDEDDMPFDAIVLTGHLDAIDKSGNKYPVVKTYKLGEKTRGLAAFRSDYRTWSGRKLKDQDLVAFNAEELMNGQPATFVIKHTKVGKEMVAVLDKLLPAPAAGPTQSETK